MTGKSTEPQGEMKPPYTMYESPEGSYKSQASILNFVVWNSILNIEFWSLKNNIELGLNLLGFHNDDNEVQTFISSLRLQRGQRKSEVALLLSTAPLLSTCQCSFVLDPTDLRG